jgi:hypothetical protein
MARPGYYHGLRPLSDIAPAADLPACRMLLNGQRAEAARAFKARLAKDPDDFAAYFGLLQAQPERCAAEVRQQAAPHTWRDRVKLGIALYIQWGTGKPINNDSDEPVRIRIRQTLEDAWLERYDTFLALMLTTVPQYHGQRVKPSQAMDTALRELAGPAAYAMYKSAGADKWNADPPPLRLVPTANRKPLRAVLRILWGWALGRWGHGVMKNGQYQIVWDPIPPERQAVGRYLDAWIKNIEKAMAAQAGSE